MVEQVHKHITEELSSNSKTDTIFVITAILLNLITLAINSGLAGSGNNMLVVFVFVLLIIVVNVTVEIGLLKGLQTRKRLLEGLIKMYEDNNVSQYYNPENLNAYSTRYYLFMFTVLCTGLVAIAVPFLIM